MNQPLNRRRFLFRLGSGLTGVALASLVARDTFASSGWQPPDGKPHFRPKAKSVIWLFMIGGASHVETFDPKPALNKYAGKSIADTPLPREILDPSFIKDNIRTLVLDGRKVRTKLFPLQVGYRKRGQSGIEVSDWFPHVGDCIDDIAVIRSMWTDDIDHGAQLQFHTGRNRLDGFFPTIGSWVHYGLGSLNENLPQFVVLGRPIADCCGGNEAHRANYLGPQHDGVPLAVDPSNPLPFVRPEKAVFLEEQSSEFRLLRQLSRLSAEQYPDDDDLRARIKSYELAFRMQSAVPDVFRFGEENAETHRLYGLDEATTRPFGQTLLAARRLVERGVRFVQVYHGGTGNAGAWDAHSNLKTNHSRNCAQVDKPIAGLLKDLKQRGLLDETIVVWATEFGRTPGAERSNGRDHHPFGFSVWMAGGGIKGGIVHGATDEIGFHAVENRHYVSDIHATLLHQLGLDPHRLAVPGRKRLEFEIGKPIREILS
ncbi:MAG: sulfatase [Gemmatales bacterium]|nr:MAG: sulfatase [Gemmatales bacterium]